MVIIAFFGPLQSKSMSDDRFFIMLASSLKRCRFIEQMIRDTSMTHYIENGRRKMPSLRFHAVQNVKIKLNKI